VASGSARGERGGEGAQLALLARYLDRASSGASIAFVGCPWDGRRKIHKSLLAAATVADVSRPDPRQVPGWIEARARTAGGKIDAEAAALLAELRGNDTMRLGAEIEKLLLYAGKRAVTSEDVLALVAAGEAPTAWALVDAVADGDAQRALGALDRLLEEGEAPPAIVGALASRLRQMIVLCDEKDVRRTNDAARAIVFPGRSIYFADALARKAGRFRPDALTDALAALYAVDRRTKSSSLDAGALLEEWLVSLLQTTGIVRS
jgi:DNA polymerase-3 subunit delta